METRAGPSGIAGRRPPGSSADLDFHGVAGAARTEVGIDQKRLEHPGHRSRGAANRELMALSLRVDGLEADGVSLLSPTSATFDDLARPLLGERIADIGLKLKPMLVIVSNETSQTIVSLSVAWRITHQSGRRTSFWSHTSFADIVCGDVLVSQSPRGLEAGQQRIEANGVVIHQWGYGDPYFDQFLGQFVDQRNALLGNALELQIALDAVIFVDGTLVGPDEETALSDRFSNYVRAKQEWYRGLVEALDRGASVAQAFEPVERFLADARAKRRAIPRTFDVPDVWTQQAAADATRWRRKFADEEIPALLRQTLRLDPFIVRRAQSSKS
jgi:hypothetical protein